MSTRNYNTPVKPMCTIRDNELWNFALVTTLCDHHKCVVQSKWGG